MKQNIANQLTYLALKPLVEFLLEQTLKSGEMIDQSKPMRY